MAKKMATEMTCGGCHERFNFQISKPNRITPSLAKVTCPGCASRFFVQWQKTKDGFSFSTDPIEITARAKEAFAARQKEAAK